MVSCFKVVGMRDSIIILIFFGILLSVRSSPVQGNPDGFISIDCGSVLPQLIDSQTNFTWVDDGDYVTTGKNVAVPYEVNSGLDNYQALGSFRYFPERRRKHCYELNMKNSNISFLIRAMFLHGRSSVLDLPITFDVYVNATLWTTVKYAMGDNLTEPQVREGIFFMPTGGITTNVCLVPKKGVPFISSLELRQFDPEGIVYSESFADRENLFFSNLIRWNVGTPDYAPTVRYPDDAYDRLWINPNLSWQDLYVQNASLPSIGSIDSKLNNVPYKVMMDALAVWEIDDDFAQNFPLPAAAPDTLVYGPAILYSYVRNSSMLNSSTGQLLMRVSVDTVFTGKDYLFNVTNKPSIKSFNTILNGNSSILYFTGPFVINAWEFYQQGVFSPAKTNTYIADTLNHLKKILNMTDWQGDPCTPVPYDWITCSSFDAFTYYAKSITLSQLQNSSRLMLLTRSIQVSALSITHSSVNDKTFKFLLMEFLDGQNTFLDFSYNSISVFPNTTMSDDDFSGLYPYESLYSLNLSFNHLKIFPRFIDFPYSGSLQILNISHNILEDTFDHLQLFNLSELRLLDISSNHMIGLFPSNFLSNAFPSLQKLVAERNYISGVLNLTIWHQSLLHRAFENFSDNFLNRSFSFVMNNISHIYPDVNEFEAPIEILIKNMSNFNQTGILLGGNPYCRNAKSFTQRYLCRSSFLDIVHENKGERSQSGLIIGVVLGGSLLSVFCVILFVTTWRLWKQVSSLKEIQQELASRKVQPPFFSYNDLKVATKNFHHKNKLGSGAFGAVYKGVLADETTVAVKRLFNFQRKQVLHEFLNEVVLITGIKHKNLVQLKGCCIKDQERILIYEYAERGNLVEALWGTGNDRILDWKDRLNICAGIARGLSYLHEELQPRIIHRDIKPANVLLDKSLNAKIADFGLAKSFYEEDNEADFTHIAGTKGYFAPEYVIEGHLTTKADVFSCGILILEIISGRKCLDPNQPPNQVFLKSWAQKLQKSGKLLDLLEPGLRTECSEAEAVTIINIALMCVRGDPQLRPTMSQVTIMLLELMGDKLRNLNIENSTEELNANTDAIYASSYNREEDIATSEYGNMTYGNSTLLEESEEIPMIETQSKTKSKVSIGSASGKQKSITV